MKIKNTFEFVLVASHFIINFFYFHEYYIRTYVHTYVCRYEILCRYLTVIRPRKEKIFSRKLKPHLRSSVEFQRPVELHTIQLKNLTLTRHTRSVNV